MIEIKIAEPIMTLKKLNSTKNSGYIFLTIDNAKNTDMNPTQGADNCVKRYFVFLDFIQF